MEIPELLKNSCTPLACALCGLDFTPSVTSKNSL